MGRKSSKRLVSVSDSVFQDTLLSCLGSLFAFLLVRWVTEPTLGFTSHLLIYIGCALLFSVVGIYISGINRELRAESSEWSGTRILSTILVKNAGLLVVLLLGVVGRVSAATVAVDILADMVFSAALLFYPRILVSRTRKEDRELRNLSGSLNALVFGDNQAALGLARKAEGSGRFCVLGLLSRKPELSGKVIGEYVVYYAVTDEELDQLQWRLGGVDCILFPKGGGDYDPSTQGHDTQQAAHGAGDSVPLRDNMDPFSRFIKRSFDVLLSGAVLLVFSPLIGICALAVLIEDGRPVMYRQERIGRGGKPFGILKFRTMRLDAEIDGPALYSGDDDPRLTRVGRFLRQHHLDELPQLWNVFRGDMSFIGYRPERKYFIDKIMAVNPRYRYLYQIRPGVTSYATLYNGYTDTLEKMLTRLDLDLYYLRNHSLWFDFRILGLTFLSIVGGKKF